MSKKKIDKAISCTDCIHECACLLWNLGRAINPNDPVCPLHETVKESDTYYCGYRDGVKAEKGVDNSWIPVTKEMPIQLQNVLVANFSNGQWDIDKAWLSPNSKGEFDRCGKPPLCHVLYWMPMPEPPIL